MRLVEAERPGPPLGRWRARIAYLRTLLRPGDEALFPAVAHQQATLAALADERPDVLLAHGTPAIAAAWRAPFPKLALAGDPPGTSRRLRAQWDPLYASWFGRDAFLHRIGTKTYAARADARSYAMLRRYDSVGEVIAWITDKKKGPVTYPGLYVGRIDGDRIAGTWQVPSARQHDEFSLTRGE